MPQSPSVERLFLSMVAFSRSMRAHSPLWSSPLPGLSRSDVIALGVIADEGPCRASLLSERMGVGASVVSRLVSALHQQGLVDREPDPEDGRAELLQLTPTGQAARLRARAAYVDALAARLAGWETDRIDVACDILGDLAATLIHHDDQKDSQ
jgi:DNA-binding MarR family transcriptional regulator